MSAVVEETREVSLQVATTGEETAKTVAAGLQGLDPDPDPEATNVLLALAHTVEATPGAEVVSVLGDLHQAMTVPHLLAQEDQDLHLSRQCAHLTSSA